MAVVKVGTKNEVTIPKRVREKLGVKPGDFVELSVRRVNDFPETDEPIGPKTRAGIRQAKKEIREGKVSPPIRTKKELHDYLAKLKKHE